MIYEIVNGHTANHISNSELQNIIEYAAEQLGMIDHDVFVDVIVSKDLSLGEAGYCNGIDDDQAEIEINGALRHQEIVATIIHELVHVRQVIRGDLVQGECGEPTTWKGQQYCGVNYVELPWEVEAHELEIELTERYYALA